MQPDILISLFGIAFAAAWTPGPNNSMLASSGATYGLWRTLPHALGVTFGYPVMIFLVGLGLGEVFRQSEALRALVRILGLVMMIWIAWKIATAKRPGDPGAATKPLTFLASAAFQWVNPKGWLAAIAITSQFVSHDAPLITATIIAGVFVLAGITSALSWTGFGQILGALLNTNRRLRVFNVTMAALLLVFLVPVLLSR